MTTPEYDRWADALDREAVGETLSTFEQEILRSYPSVDPVARAELSVWAAMAAETEGPAVGAAADRPIAERAARAVTRARAAEKRAAAERARRPWFIIGAGASVAAAASFAFLSLGRMTHGTAVFPEGTVEYVAVGAHMTSGAVLRGMRLPENSELVAAGGPVCVNIQPRIHACLADGAKIRLSKIGPGMKRVDLLAGRVAIALFPLPPGQRFSVVANGVWSTAVGTAFTVELEANGTVETIVHEGKVAVGAENAKDIVDAHKIGLATGGNVTLAPLESHARTETPEWAVLGSVAGRSIEAPMAQTASATPALVVPDVPPAEAPKDVVAAKVEPAHHVAAAQPPASAPDLLAAARQALRDQRWGDAATSYRQLATAYPSTPEAHTVLVPLANLELDRLGQPAVALQDLNAYLGTGGPLVVEARLAKIQAYRALGKTDDEARAIDEFLAAHPNSLEAPKLRERRSALGQ